MNFYYQLIMHKLISNNYSFLFILHKIYCAIYFSVCLLAWFLHSLNGVVFYLLCTVVCLTTHVNFWSQIGDKNRLIHESNIELQTMDYRYTSRQKKFRNAKNKICTNRLRSWLQYLGLLWIKFSHCYKRRILIKTSLTSYINYFILL